MTTHPEGTRDVSVPAPDAPQGPVARAVAIFLRPQHAWAGLDRRVQWWFPVLITALVTTVLMLATYDRVMLPTMIEPMEKQLSEGQMSQAQFDRMESYFSGPAGRATTIATQVVSGFILNLLVALFVWFGGAFLLGRPFGYRLALEVSSWSALVGMPAAVLAQAIAYFREASLRSVHLGFGVLLPEADTPSKLLVGLGVFLDGIGPLGIWYVAVVSLGVAALSGAPRRSAAWVVAGLYVGLVILGAALAAMFTPGS